MGSSGGSATLRAEEVVRRFYDFLARGRLVDALNLFTTDARLRDASGRESAGIRAITSSLLTYRVPQDIAVEEMRSEEHTSELQSRLHLVCRLLLEKKKKKTNKFIKHHRPRSLNAASCVSVDTT